MTGLPKDFQVVQVATDSGSLPVPLAVALCSTISIVTKKSSITGKGSLTSSLDGNQSCFIIVVQVQKTQCQWLFKLRSKGAAIFTPTTQRRGTSCTPTMPMRYSPTSTYPVLLNIATCGLSDGERTIRMAQNVVHHGRSYPFLNIRMHAYGDISSIPRADNRRPRSVFDDVVAAATSAAHAEAASPSAC